MKKIIESDKKLRYSFEKNEYYMLMLKTLINNKNIKKEVRWNALLVLQSNLFSKNSIRYVSRCVFTGRSRSVSKNLRMNRLEIFRRLKKGDLPGYVSCRK